MRAGLVLNFVFGALTGPFRRTNRIAHTSRRHELQQVRIRFSPFIGKQLPIFSYQAIPSVLFQKKGLDFSQAQCMAFSFNLEVEAWALRYVPRMNICVQSLGLDSPAPVCAGAFFPDRDVRADRAPAMAGRPALGAGCRVFGLRQKRKCDVWQRCGACVPGDTAGPFPHPKTTSWSSSNSP
jgi:hypothetical protein